MEFILCNKCGISPAKRQLLITSCSHVTCEQCLAQRADFCPVCKNPTKTLKLDKNLPKNVKRMFANPSVLAAEAQKRLVRIMAFQKEQQAIQMKIEVKKEAGRKDQISKLEQKTQEIASHLQKIEAFHENTTKKIKKIESENEKLEKLIKKTEEELAAVQTNENYDDFFLRDTPTCSSPSADSNTDQEDMFDFDLLGLKSRADALDDQLSSSQGSSRQGSLF
uniref:RING-type domain-containing protein n=1 Tax=Caenorhabditis japonica TaxID=281687 RepID=A0A8R1EV58_CAEJA